MVYVGCYEAYVKSGCYIKSSLRKDKTQCRFYESAYIWENMDVCLLPNHVETAGTILVKIGWPLVDASISHVFL